MRRNFVSILILAAGLLLLTACGPETSGAQPQDQQPAVVKSATDTPEPAVAATEAPTALPTDTTATDAPDAITETESTASGAATSLQPLQWAGEDENCLIPGLVISGMVSSDAPCSPADTADEPVDETAQADASAESADSTADTNDQDAATQPVQDAETHEVTALAVEDLANQLSIPEDEIKLCDVCQVTWPDTSLGCPQPDMMYAQMLQEGYLIQLTVDGKPYFYHSGGTQAPFQCEEDMQNLPDGVDIGD